MNKSTLSAVILGIMAAIGFGLYFTGASAQSKLDAQVRTLDARVKQLESENQRLSTEDAALRKANADALLKAQSADEALRLAESKLAADEAARQAQLEELNARLRKESAERQAAVDQAQLLEARVAELTIALEEARKQTTSPAEASADTAKNMAEVASLQALLNEKTQLAADRGAKILALEDEIAKLKAELEKSSNSLNSPAMRSMNYRGRDARYLQSRVE